MSTYVTPFGTLQFDPTVADPEENLRISFAIQCAAKNNSEVSKFNSQFQGWLVSRAAHPDLYPDSSAPQPPKAWMPVPAGSSWDMQQAGQALCGMPPIPNLNIHPDTSADAQKEYLKAHRPMNTAQGETADNPPIGSVATDPADGSKWVKVLKGVTPWGKAVEWVQQ